MASAAPLHQPPCSPAPGRSRRTAVGRWRSTTETASGPSPQRHPTMASRAQHASASSGRYMPDTYRTRSWLRARWADSRSRTHSYSASCWRRPIRHGTSVRRCGGCSGLSTSVCHPLLRSLSPRRRSPSFGTGEGGRNRHVEARSTELVGKIDLRHQRHAFRARRAAGNGVVLVSSQETC